MTSTVNIFCHRSFLARLRGGTAPLAIETSRYIDVLQKDAYVKIAVKRWKTKYISLPHANVLNCKGKFYMSIFKSHPEFTISLTRTSIYICILHHANSSSKTAELVYIFIARKCVNL